MVARVPDVVARNWLPSLTALTHLSITFDLEHRDGFEAIAKGCTRLRTLILEQVHCQDRMMGVGVHLGARRKSLVGM